MIWNQNLFVHLQTIGNYTHTCLSNTPSFSNLHVVLMRYRICTVHVQVERISHWWQQCWSIKDSTFYPENSASSGGQLTPRQTGSEMSWRFLPCGRRGRPQSRNAHCWCTGLCWCVCVCFWVCVWQREKRRKGYVWLCMWEEECVCVCVCVFLCPACVCMQRWQAVRGVQVRCSAG